MLTARDFFSEFWPAFLGTLVGLGLLWFLGRFASDARLALLGAEEFPELRSFTKDQQRVLLYEACAMAFRDWGSFLPLIVLAGSLATGVASADALSKTGTIPDAIWARAGVCALFAAGGGWLANRLTMRCLRPFLRTCAQRTLKGVKP